MVLMMTSIESYVRRGQVQLRQWAGDSRVRLGAKITGVFLAGFFLSAAALANTAQPIAMGLLLVMQGWMAPVLAAGSSLGYFLLWGNAGYQGIVWMAAALPCALLGLHRRSEGKPLLIAAAGGAIAAVTGLVFGVWMGDAAPIPIYLLRIAVGASSGVLFGKVLCRGDPAADWVCQGIAVLALSQFSLFPEGNLGMLAAGALAAGGAFPGAALGGLALDLVGVSRTPMTAVMCLSFLTRLLPSKAPHAHRLMPGIVYLLVMGLCGVRDPLPAIALTAGGLLSALLPPAPKLSRRRGETGVAQVHLELMASALSQTQQLLLEAPDAPVDENALLERTRERACGSCPSRRGCTQRGEALDPKLLHTVLTDTASLPLGCRKPGRMILELRRTQEQLRLIRADRRRQQEYRWAVIQQYQFLSEYLREQADLLPHRAANPMVRFSPEVKVCSAGRDTSNGDRLLWFPGTCNRYFVLLCDGMGTGIAAAQEGQTAAALLRQMLSGGFPAEYALRSLNSLLVLRGKAAAATADLAEIHLDTGRCTVYKWGAAPSILLREQSAEKIGTAGPPPGLWMTEGRESSERVSLRRGEVLILCSDGVDTDAVLRQLAAMPVEEGEALALKVLQWGTRDTRDDATAAVIRLVPAR